jgi:DnaK suppressor protein
LSGFSRRGSTIRVVAFRASHPAKPPSRQRRFVQRFLKGDNAKNWTSPFRRWFAGPLDSFYIGGVMKKEQTPSPVENTVPPVPPGEYMSAQQLQFFRILLEDERRKLLENVQGTLDHMHAIVSESDPNDRASTEENFSLEFRVRDRERKLLRKSADALERIENGTYGWCQETGEPIGIRRLLARPTATLTIEAQERHELQERARGR